MPFWHFVAGCVIETHETTTHETNEKHKNKLHIFSRSVYHHTTVPAFFFILATFFRPIGKNLAYLAFRVSFGLRWVCVFHVVPPLAFRLPVSTFRLCGLSPRAGLSFQHINARPVFPSQVVFLVSLSFGLLFAFLYLARFAGFRPSFVRGVRLFSASPLRPFSRFTLCSVSRLFSRVPFGCPLGERWFRSSCPFRGGFYCVRRVSCFPSLPCPVFAVSFVPCVYKERERGAVVFHRKPLQNYCFYIRV